MLSLIHISYIYPNGTLVKAGQEITFTGKGFGTDKNSVTVTFEGISVPVTVKELSLIHIYAKQIKVSYIGYVDQIINLHDRSDFKVVLKEDNNACLLYTSRCV